MSERSQTTGPHETPNSHLLAPSATPRHTVLTHRLNQVRVARYGETAASDPEWAAADSVCSSYITKDIQKQATALSPGHPLSGERVRRIPRFSNDVLRINKEKRIGTWNVQSMYQAGKAANIVKEVKRLQIDILGCSETRWPDSGHCTIDEHHIYFSGDHTTRNRNGVAIILNKQTNEAVKGFIPISSRVAVIKIKSKPFDLNIIQSSYAPTTESSEQKMEEFYEQLRTALKHTRREEVNMMLRDMKGKVEDVVGEFGLGVRNEWGERLIEFCEEMNFTIMNTFFKLPSRRLYTWKSPADSSHRIIRNQIDFIMINRRYRNTVVSCNISQTSNHGTEIEDLWNRIKTSIVSVTEEELRQDKQAKRQECMTDAILEYRNRDTEKYREVHRRVLRKIKETKEQWLQEKCAEIEILQAKHDSFNLHKKIKEAAGRFQIRNTGVLLDSDNNTITEVDKKLARWKEYMQKLFGEENVDNVAATVNTEGPTITQEEVEAAIKRLKNNKSPGPDQIHGEVLKLLDSEQIKLITTFFNKIYIDGQLPKDWLMSTFIPLPKKANATKCSEYRIISLMSHALKAFLNIIQARIYKRLDENISANQFGFRKGLGTREALFAIQVLIQ
ncbi:craniofacial development protein 2-like [Cylas formicarius]|uniref:craniofacial development protein 2-like n=1 Tax=Cylas formicarius TaxID=197179 RepID=UPI002958B6F1|nr:craniofacial development protein 2-like [Cylas formicarius]